MLSYLAEFNPSIVGIEKPLLVPTKRAALVSVIAQELHVGMKVVEISPREVRRIVVGNPYARKIEVGRAIVEMGFEDLRVQIPKDAPHPALGYNPRDRYHLHMFDALAVGLAVENLRPSTWTIG